MAPRGGRTKRIPAKLRGISTPSPAAASAAASASRGSANSGGTAAASSTTRGRGTPIDTGATPIDTGAALSTNRGGTAVGYKYPEDTFCVILANNEALTAETTGVDSITFRNSFDLDDNQIVCASGLACTNPEPVEGSTHRCFNCTLKYHSLFQCGVLFFEDFLSGKEKEGERVFHHSMLSPNGREKYVQYNGDISNLPICNNCQHRIQKAMREDDESDNRFLWENNDSDNRRLRDGDDDDDIGGEDDDNIGGEDGINVNDDDSIDGPTDAEVSRFDMQARLVHYMHGERITTKSRKAVEAVLLMEALSILTDKYPMCLKSQEKHIKQHYLNLINCISNDLFENASLKDKMIRNYSGARNPNHEGLYRYAKTERNNVRDFGSNFPGIKSLNELPSGHTQIRDSMNPYIVKLWKIKFPVSVF